MSILASLGIDGSIFGSMITEPDILESGTNTTMLRLDKEVPYKGSINGQPIDAMVTLRGAALTRLSLLQQYQKSNNNRPYWLVTGVMQPVSIDIDLMIDGSRINMVDLFHQIAEESAGQSITKEQFLVSARKIGMNFVEGQPLFFQQFGASIDKFAELLEVFKAAGAQDVIADIKGNTGRIQAAYSLKPGLPITAFEVGTTDRKQSARYAHDGVGQGFLDLVDAQFTQFTRILGLRKSAKVKRAEAEAAGIDEKTAIALRDSANLDMKMSKMAISNWAGAQRRLVQMKDSSFRQDDIFDPVNLPCGRFTLDTSAGMYEADLWTNNRGTNATTSTVPTLKAGVEPEPF